MNYPFEDGKREGQAERDQLRAEVERLRADAERWHVANLTAETAWKHPDHRSQEENTAFSAYRCAVEDGLNGPFATDFGKHTHNAMAAGAKNCAAAIEQLRGE